MTQTATHAGVSSAQSFRQKLFSLPVAAAMGFPFAPLMKLNPSQSAVVACRARRILVMAGAGTGKTATSVHWVASLVRSGVPRSAVLMITFTRKAANEMAARVETLIAAVPRKSADDRLAVGTYHAVASLLMRKEGEKFGLTNSHFSTLDESESQSVWKSALKQTGLSTKSKLFVPGRLNELYSFARNTRVPVAEVFEPLFGGHTKRMLKVTAAYEELKRAANVVDYDDLLVLWAQRLERDAAWAKHLRDRWRYVLVDEMQDNNRLNQAVLDGLNPHHLMVVGDANQSIYAFRGSEVRLITDFPGKNRDTQILKLENNYRSAQPILDLANEVVANTESALRLQAANDAQGTVEYRKYFTPAHEAAGIIKWIVARKAAGKRGCDCAVLARSSRSLTALEVLLNQHRIRYKKYGGLALADAAEVKDFLCFLRVAQNPRDKIALLRALTQFPGIGEGTAAKAIAAHRGQFVEDNHWPEEAAELPRWIHDMRRATTLGAKGKLLFEKIRPLMLANYPKDGEERLATLNTLANSMANAPGSLHDFLDGFNLSRDTDETHPTDAVILSTIHSSKGLEWDGVWLVGAGHTQMPHPRTQATGEIDEERRLFYVAATRAKHDLVISFPALTERKTNQKPTPFVPASVYWQFLSS